MAMFTTTIRVNALDNTKGAFGSAMQGLARVQHQLNKVGTQTQLAGFRMTAAITYPMQRFGRSAITAAKDMSEAENQLRAVLKGGMLEDLKEQFPGITEQQALVKVTQGMKDLRAEAHRMAEGSRFDIIEVTQAQKFLSMAGLGQQQVLGSTEATIAAATALSMDVATVADKLSNTALGFGLMDSESGLDEARDAMTKIADVVAFTASRTNVSGRQAFETLKSLGPVARGTGRDLEEMAAMMGVLGNNGIQGAEAGVALRSSIARVAAPTKKMLGLFKSINLDLDNFISRSGELNSKDLFQGLMGTGLLSASDISKIASPIERIFASTDMADNEKMAAVSSTIKDILGLDPADLESLGDAIATFGMSNVEGFAFQDFMKQISEMGLSYGQLADIFGKRHVTKMQALMYGIVDSFRIEDEIRNGAMGQANRMLEEQMAGLFGALERLRSTWKNFQTNLFTGEAGDVLIAVVEKLRLVIQWMDSLSPATKTALMIFAALAAVLGPLLIYFGMLIQFGGVVVGVFGSLGSAVGAVVKAIGKLSLRSLISAFSKGAGGVSRFTAALRGMTLPGLALTAIISVLKSVKERLTGAADQVRRFWRALKGVVEYFAILNFRKFTDDTDGVRRASIILKYHLDNLTESAKILAKEIGLGVLEGLFGDRNLGSILQGFEGIRNGLTNISEAVQAFWQGFQGQNGGPGILASIFDAVGQMLKDTQDRITWVIEKLGWLMDKFNISAQSAESFGKRVREVVDWLKQKFEDAVGTVKAFAEQLKMESLQWLIDKFTEAKPALNTFVEAMKTAFGWVVEFTKALEPVWDAFVEALRTVVTFLQSIGEGVVGYWKSLYEVLSNLFDLFAKPVLIAEWITFKDDLVGLWNEITGAINAAISAWERWQGKKSVMDGNDGVTDPDKGRMPGQGARDALREGRDRENLLPPTGNTPLGKLREGLPPSITGPSILDQLVAPSAFTGGPQADGVVVPMPMLPKPDGVVVTPPSISPESVKPQEDNMASAMTRALDRKFGEGNLQAKLDGKANVVVSLKGFPQGTTATSTSKGDVSTTLDLGGSSLSA